MKLEGISTQPRRTVVFEVKESIQHCGGSILDHQQFSIHLLRLSIEIWPERLKELLAALETAGVSMSRTSINDAEETAQEASDARIAGTLVIRFVSDEPDLRIPVPAIPG